MKMFKILETRDNVLINYYATNACSALEACLKIANVNRDGLNHSTLSCRDEACEVTLELLNNGQIWAYIYSDGQSIDLIY